MSIRFLLAALVLAALPGSRAVAGPATGVAPDPAPAAMARLVLEQRDGEVLAWAENLLAGPIEVMLRGDGPAVPAARPALPARATVPPRGRALVARLGPAVPRDAGLALQAVPGHPGVRVRDVEYAWPLQGAGVQVAQHWGGAVSHGSPDNLHAVDLAAPAGTPVLAARDGVVMQTESRFARGAPDPRLEGQANFVRILHDDGTMALYAHLDANGVFVRPGQPVRRGERLGLSGSTGYSAAPHLHFVVQANRGMRLESIPFRMFSPDGILRFHDPARGDGP